MREMIDERAMSPIYILSRLSSDCIADTKELRANKEEEKIAKE